jgi:hypothetical protein
MTKLYISQRDAWDVSDYVEQLMTLSEVVEVPGVNEQISQLRYEMLHKFTKEELEAQGVVPLNG